MNNIPNIQNNLSNICYLYTNLRFENRPDCIALEYEDDTPTKDLLKKLNDYFIKRSWDVPETWLTLDLVGKDIFNRSLQAFKKISEIIIDPDEKLIFLKYPFLSTNERANHALVLLKVDNINDFKDQFVEFTEEKLYLETDAIMLILGGLNDIVSIKREEED